ncbi:MAG: hypothetical protein ACRD4Q_15360 [Candidatus Acidiferrales bacterium]
MIYFPKSFVLGALALLLFFMVGLFLYVYFQGGVESSIYLGGR